MKKYAEKFTKTPAVSRTAINLTSTLCLSQPFHRVYFNVLIRHSRLRHLEAQGYKLHS